MAQATPTTSRSHIGTALAVEGRALDRGTKTVTPMALTMIAAAMMNPMKPIERPRSGSAGGNPAVAPKLVSMTQNHEIAGNRNSVPTAAVHKIAHKAKHTGELCEGLKLRGDDTTRGMVFLLPNDTHIMESQAVLA